MLETTSRLEGVGMTAETFAAKLKRLRETAGLTQNELAERAGMNPFGVAKLEQGARKPTWATVQALAAALGVSCEAFTSPPATDEPRERGRPPKPPAGGQASESKPTRRRKKP
jgi:transcriptional regulator with XRE-family HTH domain